MTKTEGKKAAAVAEQGAQGVPKESKSRNVATRSKNAPKAAGTATAGAGKKKGEKTRNVRDGSKKAKVLALLGHKDGATLAQLIKATGWQAHSVRGFLSGALGKKMGLKIDSAKQENGDRIYRLE
jgi:hypothetical protein